MKAVVCYEFGKPLVVEEVHIDPPQRGEVKVASPGRASAIVISMTLKGSSREICLSYRAMNVPAISKNWEKESRQCKPATRWW
jgi:hypothetical protein